MDETMKIIQIETDADADLLNLIMYTVNFNSWLDCKNSQETDDLRITG